MTMVSISPPNKLNSSPPSISRFDTLEENVFLESVNNFLELTSLSLMKPSFLKLSSLHSVKPYKSLSVLRSYKEPN